MCAVRTYCYCDLLKRFSIVQLYIDHPVYIVHGIVHTCLYITCCRFTGYIILHVNERVNLNVKNLFLFGFVHSDRKRMRQLAFLICLLAMSLSRLISGTVNEL